jgi:predicted enzyme related to lactoylglutathione lyase
MRSGFCWVDLAARDAQEAKRFYAEVLDWRAHDQVAHGGVFTRLRAGEADVGSLYQLRAAQLAAGTPSQWTPYAVVARVDEAVRRVVAARGRIVVEPFDVAGLARIALVQDAVGALLGLWQAHGDGDGGGRG